VVFEAPTGLRRACFDEYGLLTDSSGSYSTLLEALHLSGLELGISVASVALQPRIDGCAPTGSGAIAVATAGDLQPGEVTLDGGKAASRSYGKLMPGRPVLAAGGPADWLLAHHGKSLKTPSRRTSPCAASDVDIDEPVRRFGPA